MRTQHCFCFSRYPL